MLSRLFVRDIVLVSRADLVFDSGLSVLTGETGAGKSVILDALLLAIGKRGASELVRKGCGSGEVCAVFEISSDHPVRAILADLSFSVENSLVLRRVQYADGKTSAFLNDRPVSVQTLRDVGEYLLQIHGQKSDRLLVDRAYQRFLLDSFAKNHDLLTQVATRYGAMRETLERLEALGKESEILENEREYVAHAVDELKALAPEKGEEAELSEQRRLARVTEKLFEEFKEIDAFFSDNFTSTINRFARQLERAAQQDPEIIESLSQDMESVIAAVEAFQMTLAQKLSTFSRDTRVADTAEERLFALRGAARKYRVDTDALSELLDKFLTKFDTIQNHESQCALLEKTLAEQKKLFQETALSLSRSRHAAAALLDRRVMVELPALKLETAVFETKIATNENTPARHGIDDVLFQARTNLDSAMAALAKVASGGELSRFTLALKVILADVETAGSLIFDEIDAGVGGAVADAIGQRLRDLAKRVQVITITHSPQVAVCANAHFLVTKSHDAQRSETMIKRLDHTERHEEIARMLSGKNITPEARAAAERLLTEP